MKRERNGGAFGAPEAKRRKPCKTKKDEDLYLEVP